MKKALLYLGLVGLATTAAGRDYKVPAWEPGEMELHVICTGRGEANFMIMPDGTSMLIDAGDWNDLLDEMAPAMPDERYRAGEYIKRYIQAVNPHGNDVDYLMVSHFHNDHTGDTQVRGLPRTKDCNPNYIIAGITEVGQEVKFKKEFDRGYPDYNYPIKIEDPDVDNLRAFLENQARDNGLVQEMFIVGALNQIKQNYSPEQYDGLFSIRNLAASGEVWTGKENETVRGYDLNEKNKTGHQNENTNSLAIRVDYGPFGMFLGGDLTGSLLDANGEWYNLENMAGRVCGPVDVTKLNHHGYRGSTSEPYVKSLDARTYLIPAWDYWHIQPTVMSNIENGGRFNGSEPIVFSTHVFYNHKKEFGDNSWFKMIAPEYGHIVVKVDKGGKTYSVYIVDATDEEMNVLAKYGPYKSGEHKK